MQLGLPFGPGFVRRVQRYRPNGTEIHAFKSQLGCLSAVIIHMATALAVERLKFSPMFGIAEIERAHIRERQTAGIAAAKQCGVYTGRKRGTTKAPIGPGAPCARLNRIQGHFFFNFAS